MKRNNRIELTKVNNGFMVNTRVDAPKNSMEATKAMTEMLGPLLKQINQDEDDPILTAIKQQQEAEDQLSGIFVFKTLTQAIDFIRTYYDEK